MASFTTGRKYFNINKNLESGSGIYYNDVYARTRFSPDLKIGDRKPNPELEEVDRLKYMLQEKEEKLARLRENLDSQYEDPPIHPVYNDLVVNSAYESKQCVEIYDSHFKYLNQQIKDRELKKIEQNLARQKETQDRLQQMFALRDFELQQRKKAQEQAEDYRNSLLLQQSFNKKIEQERKARSVTPRNENKIFRKSIINAQNILASPERAPVITKDQVMPVTKNISRITPELSALSAFQQPRYTKHSPKVQPSYPVVGSKANNYINKQDLDEANYRLMQFNR